MSENRAIIAPAGSRKTADLIDAALAIPPDERVLVTTYTNANRGQVVRRIIETVGYVPPNISILGWFAFLISQCSKPYQRALTGDPLVIRGLNFKGRRRRHIKKDDARHYFLDERNCMYRDGVSDFVVGLNQVTSGAVIRRLERVYQHIFIDEVQDLVGYDLDVLQLLLESECNLTMVGDPRQHIIETNLGPRNKKFRGVGLLDWFRQRADTCILLERNENYRCNQAICDFSDAIFPTLPRTKSIGVPSSGHDGIHRITRAEVVDYVNEHPDVAVLRRDRRAKTLGLQAMNFGIAKGSTFDRVLIFPTGAMRKYLSTGDPTDLTEPERLYVAVTRARYSVAFVVD